MTRYLPALVPAVALLGMATPLPADAPTAPSSPGLAAPNAADGRALFKQRCASCHATEAGRASSMGPNLAGVVGRGAGTTDYRYSAALKASGLKWTRENLSNYIAAPQKLVPGTSMVVSLSDYAQRAAVVDYLAGLSGTPVPITTVPSPTRRPHDHSGH